MTANVNCPIIPHPITVPAVKLGDGTFNYQIPVFCSECRQSYDFKHVTKLDNDIQFALTDEERQRQIESFDTEEAPLEAA